METYKSPVAKIAVMRTFLFRGICNFQSDGIGRARMPKSDSTLNIPEAKKRALLLKQ